MFVILLKLLMIIALIPTILFVLGFGLYHGSVLYEDYIRPHLKKVRQAKTA